MRHTGGSAIVEWLVGLLGDEAAIAVFCHLLSGSPWELVHEGDSYCLRGEDLAPFTDAGQVRGKAQRQVEAMRAVAGLAGRPFPSVSVGGKVVRVHEDGTRTTAHILFLTDGISLIDHAAITAEGGDGVGPEKSPPPPALPEPWIAQEAGPIRLYERDASVREAVRLSEVDSGADTFYFDLFSAFETVRKDVGGEQDLVAIGLVSRADIRRFRQQAQSGDESGGGRHAKGNSRPKDPWPRAQYRRWLGDLVWAWIRWKCEQTDDGAE
jgi:hypothetical protein